MTLWIPPARDPAHGSGSANELGEFESGGMARLLGPVGSAIFGGCGAILVTLMWAGMFPALRKADRLE